MIAATRLFVGNLPGHTDEQDLHAAFSAFGEIETVDLKSKSENDKRFAFVSLAAPPKSVESCINHFANQDFNGNRLYVTRARESFLERLQRERQLAQQLEAEKAECQNQLPKQNPIIKLSDKLNPRKRKIEHDGTTDFIQKNKHMVRRENYKRIQVRHNANGDSFGDKHLFTDVDDKKHEAERKRIESLKKKRLEFKEKKLIIKTGLTGVDKKHNKKIKFPDNDCDSTHKETVLVVKDLLEANKTNELFDYNADESDTEVNFEVRKQFEGKQGQKVLDLQSRYKSDKRFTLDERFIEEEVSVDWDSEEVEIGHADEKAKQLNILQDVLGVTIKARPTETDSNKKNKPKIGMPRFDPMQPDHSKFFAPIETKLEPTKKSKKKLKERQEEIKETPPEMDMPKVEVSKEQFYKVSETLKEAIAQPNTFSLRSLFGNNENVNDGPQEQDSNYISLEIPKEKKKVKNPLAPTEKNPFVYDSSDSETEEPEKEKTVELPAPVETKAVWKENLFFSESDSRLKDGLSFFTKARENEVQKERRELKSLVKKRIYNNDRKNQMFKKKIGGRKKSMKKPYKNKN